MLANGPWSDDSCVQPNEKRRDAFRYRGVSVSAICQVRDVQIDDLARFKEAGACGTAAVITPIGGIQYKDNLHVFFSREDVGPVTRRLYEELTGIQKGDVEGPEGWVVKV